LCSGMVTDKKYLPKQRTDSCAVTPTKATQKLVLRSWSECLWRAFYMTKQSE